MMKGVLSDIWDIWYLPVDLSWPFFWFRPRRQSSLPAPTKSARERALFVLFRQSQGFIDAPESKAIEVYPHAIGHKVAQKRAAPAPLLVSIRSLMPADRE